MWRCRGRRTSALSTLTGASRQVRTSSTLPVSASRRRVVGLAALPHLSLRRALHPLIAVSLSLFFTRVFFLLRWRRIVAARG